MIANRAIYQSLPDGPLQGARICIHRSQTKSIGRFLERVFTKSFPSEDPVGAHIAYVPKPVDPFRGFINGISQPTVEWCLSINIYKVQAKPKRLGVPIDMEVVARDLKDRMRGEIGPSIVRLSQQSSSFRTGHLFLLPAYGTPSRTREKEMVLQRRERKE